MGEGWTGGASDIVKAKSSGEDPRATGGLVSNLPHPRVNKTKQHWCKQVTLSTSETPVKKGLRKKIITRWHCFHSLHLVVKLVRAVKTYFVLDAEQSIAAAIFAEGLDEGESLNSE